MALRTEEAQTTGRYCERFHFNVKVLVCDHEDDSGNQCRTGYLFGEGFGDSMEKDEIVAAEEEGWTVSDDGDYCPVHADLHHNDPSEEDLDEMG